MMRKLALLSAVLGLLVASVVTIASAQGRDQVPLRGDRIAQDDGLGNWTVDGTPVTDRELRAITAVERQRDRAAALTAVKSILADVESNPAVNPEVQRVEQALLEIRTLLEP